MATNQNGVRRAAWIAGGTLVVAVAAALANRPAGRFEVQPFDISDLRALGNRSALRPHMSHIVSEIEAGRILGSQIELHRGDFEKADEMRIGKSVTWYWFYGDPQFVDQEYHPVLIIAVQNKFGHIFRCCVGSPDY